MGAGSTTTILALMATSRLVSQLRGKKTLSDEMALPTRADMQGQGSVDQPIRLTPGC